MSIFVQVATPQAPELVPAQYLLSPRAADPRTLIDILYDTAACYPDNWTPPGAATSVQDWFNQYARAAIVFYRDVFGARIVDELKIEN